MAGCENSARTSSESRTVAEADRPGPDGARPGGARVVKETPRSASGLTVFENADWQDRFPGLRCGVTGSVEGHDFGISENRSPGGFRGSYARLGRRLRFPRVVVARQIHGKEIIPVGPGDAAHDPEAPAGSGGTSLPALPTVRVAGTADGLVASRSDPLLAVTVADCIPVYLVDPGTGALGLLHAGWRGAAAGILEAGLSAMESECGACAAALHVHLGPGICGTCYEVGGEVAAALNLPHDVRTVDLREVLAERARGAGVREASLTVSTWCTRCRSDQFHSHRGSQGTAGRMAAYLGWLGSHPLEGYPDKGDPGA